MRDAYVFEAVRTPRGRGRSSGALHDVPPMALMIGLIDEIRRRCTGLDAGIVDDLVLGVVTPVGEQGDDIAKIIAIAAGLPDTVSGVQINRFCASGLDAVNQAALRIGSGMEELILAGGVESMSRVPMGSASGPWSTDADVMAATRFVPQGVGADLMATLGGWSRHDVDEYAALSHERAAAAWADGRFDRSVVPVRDHRGTVVLSRDENVRPDVSPDSLSALRPSFREIGEDGGFDDVALQRYPHVERIDHVHHAGNSSALADGAALVLVGSAEAGRTAGLVPRARIVSVAVSGADPTIMLTGPAPAARKALAKASLDVSDIDLFEVNEAFAAVPLRFVRELDISVDITNVNGGAIAMGHPLGATGAMLVSTVLDELERRAQRRGLITLCAGGGMGIATVLERC